MSTTTITTLYDAIKTNSSISFKTNLAAVSAVEKAIQLLVNTTDFSITVSNPATDIKLVSPSQLSITGTRTLYGYSINATITITATVGDAASSAKIELTSTLSGFSFQHADLSYLLPAPQMGTIIPAIAGVLNNVVLDMVASPSQMQLTLSYQPHGANNPSIHFMDTPAVSLSNWGFVLTVTKNTGMDGGPIKTGVAFDGQFTLGNDACEASISLAPSANVSTWTVDISEYTGMSPITLGDLTSVMCGANFYGAMPEVIQQQLDGWFLQKLHLPFTMGEHGPIINQITIAIGHTDITLGGLSIDGFQMRLIVLNPLEKANRSIMLAISGTVVLGADATIDLDVSYDSGQNVWEADLSGTIHAGTSYQTILEGLSLGNNIDLPLPSSLNLGTIDLDKCNIAFDATAKQIQSADMRITIEHTFNILNEFEVENPFFALKIAKDASTTNTPPQGALETTGTNKNIYTMELGGTIDMGTGVGSLGVSGTHVTNKGWTFVAQGSDIYLIALIEKFIPGFSWKHQSAFDAIELNNLYISFSEVPTVKGPTGKKDMSYTMQADFLWNLSHFGSDLYLPVLNTTGNATLSLDYTSTWQNNGAQSPTNPAKAYTGSVEMDVTFTDLDGLEVTFGCDFSKDGTTSHNDIYIEWEGIKAEYEKQTDGSSKVTIQLDHSLGYLITKLMKGIDDNFALEAPWTVLNDIDLSGIELVFEFDKAAGTSSIALEYTKTIDLLFIEIDGFKLVRKKVGGESQLMFEFNTPVFGNDSYPAQQLPTNPPGKPNKFLQLDYLAMGQHMGLKSYSNINTFEDALKDFEAAFKQPDSTPGQTPAIPVSDSTPVVFMADNDFMIGFKFTLLNFLTLGIIFNDPKLYGLLIELSGERAKIFAGLKFEIVYRKVTDSIGVYDIELRLPTEMRHLQFGEVSITLPLIGIQIYTNGNFKLDFGFPYHNNFKNSFGLQVFPFVGAGGFYFALLSGATAKNIPQTTKGHFNPVIEAGFGLQVGVGKTINEGIFSAGVTVTVQGTIQGTLAFFHPNGQHTGLKFSDLFYQIKGVIAIVGRIFGSVHFAIINASVNIRLSIQAGFTFTAYRKIPMYLKGSVHVSLDVGIDCGLFTIHIHLGFHCSIRMNLTIGSNHTAPWDPSHIGSSTMLSMIGAGSHPSVNGINWIEMDWSKRPEMNPYATTLDLYYVPMYTQLFGGDTALTSVLFINSHVDTGESSFTTMAKAIFTWSFLANVTEVKWPAQPYEEMISPTTGQSNTIKRSWLEDMQCYMAEHEGAIIPADDINALMSELFDVTIHFGPKLNGHKGSIFPMIPHLQLAVTDNATTHHTSFDSHNIVTPTQQKTMGEAFDHLIPKMNNANEQEPDMYDQTGDHLPQPTESMATFVYQDYFQLLIRNMISDAIKYMESISFPYTNQKLDELSVKFGVAKSAILTANQTATLTTTALPELMLQGPSYNYQIMGNVHCFMDVVEQQQLSMNELTAILTQAEQTQTLFNAGTIHTNVNTNITPESYPITATDTLSTIAKTVGKPLPWIFSNTDLLVNPHIVKTNIGLILKPGYFTYNSYSNYTGLSASFNIDTETFLTMNKEQSGLLATGKTLTLPSKTPYVIKANDTLSSLAKQFNFNALTDLFSSPKAIDSVIVPGQSWFLPPCTIKTLKAGDRNMEYISNTLHLSANAIGAINGDVSNLYEPTTLNIPDVTIISLPDLLTGLEETGQFTNLAGLSSRFLLHGLRLPYPTNPTALYDLTGQQTGLSLPLKSIVLENPDPTQHPWINFQLETNPTTDTLTIDDTHITALQTKLHNTHQITGIVCEHLEAIPALPYHSQGEHFNLSHYTPWNYTGSVDYSVLNPSVPVSPTPRIYQLPNSLLQQAQVKTKHVALAVKKAWHRDGDGPIVDELAGFYNSGLQLKVSVSRIPTSGSKPGFLPNTFQVNGVEGDGLIRLERLINAVQTVQSGVISADTHVLGNIHFMFNPGNADSKTSGLFSPNNDTVDCFLIRSNITSNSIEGVSNEDHYVDGSGNAPTPTRLDYTDTFDFIKRLWECSMVKQEGYYLYYAFDKGKHTLPSNLFKDSNHAEIDLLILFNDNPGVCDIYDYTNCLVVGDLFNPTSTHLYAQAQPLAVPYNFLTTDTLDGVSSGYHLYYDDLAADMATLPLSSGAQSKLNSALTAAGRSKLIPITPTTLIEYSNAYRVHLNQLAWYLKDFAPLLTTDTNITLNDMPTTRTNMIANSHVAFDVLRSKPSETVNAQDYLDNIYNLVGFTVNGDEGLPVSHQENDIPEYLLETVNTDTGGDYWYYHSLLQIPGTKASDPYQFIGQTVNIDLSLHDMFGNVATPTVTSGNPIPGFNSPLTIDVKYTDALVGIEKWPGAQVHYYVNTDQSMVISFEMDYSRYVPNPNANVSGQPSTQGAQAKMMNQVKSDLQVYTLVAQQLASNVTGHWVTSLDAEISQNTISMTDLSTNFIQKIITQLNAFIAAGNTNGASGLSPLTHDTAPVTISTTSLNLLDIFELTTTIVLQRPMDKIDYAFRAVGNVQNHTTSVGPLMLPTTTEHSNHTLKAFVQDFETAYDGTQHYLKVATGQSRTATLTSSQSKTLWVVRMAKTGVTTGVGFSVTGNPHYYAPTPLANNLLTFKGIPIQTLNSSGQLNPVISKNYSGTNIDTWGRQFLAAIDHYLQPQNSIPLHLVEYFGHTNHEALLSELLTLKRTVADALSSGTDSTGGASNHFERIFTDTVNDALFDKAKWVMRQELYNKLMSAYTIDVIAQFEVTANVLNVDHATNIRKPRLFGQPVVKGASTNDSAYSISTATILMQTASDLTFTFTANHPSQEDSFTLPMEFHVTHIEHQIQPIPVATDAGPEVFNESTWLTFIDPLAPFDLATPTIPVILRRYPTPCAMIGQTMEQTGDIHDTNMDMRLQELMKWDYSYTFKQIEAAQDEHKAEVRFNVNPTSFNQKASAYEETNTPEHELFASLAQFNAIYSDLDAAIAKGLPGVTAKTSTGNDTLYAQFEMLLHFSKAVSNDWGEWVKPDENIHYSQYSPKDRTYTIHEFPDTSGDLVLRIMPFEGNVAVSIEGFTADAVPNGTLWCDYTFISDDTNQLPLMFDDRNQYGERTITINDLNILEYQNAWSGVAIERNIDIVQGRTTMNDFIYRTPMVRFINPFVPLIDSNEPISIDYMGTTHGTKRALRDILGGMFFELFQHDPTTNQKIKLEVNFTHKLQDNAHANDVALPVLLFPAVTLDLPTDPTQLSSWDGDSDNEDTMLYLLDQLSTDLKYWYSTFNPNKIALNYPQFQFDLSVYSNIKGVNKPVLRLRNLELDLGVITDLTS